MSAALRRIRAVNYRCLRNVDVELDEFNVLVGANGSGKSALFDALLFVHDLLLVGLDTAVDQRTGDFRDLVWGRPDRKSRFQLGFELDLPKSVRDKIPRSFDRFSVSLSVSETETGNLGATLTGCLKREEIGEDRSQRGDLNPNLWRMEIPFQSSHRQLPILDYDHPVVSQLVKETFLGVNELTLENRRLRQASKAPRLGTPTPSRSLPWLILRLKRYPDHYDAWLRHLRTALPDLRDISVKTREDDRYSYLVASYGDGFGLPSWALSDGTLRLLALTVIAYLPEEGRTYLIEEPENGVHPLAVEAIYRSLSSAYGSQVLITTHSPVLLACTEPRELLCFSKRDGETRIVRGDEHPRLKHWQSAADVDLLFAPDVLG